jgi:CRP-like cAMP-binding protein
VLTDFIKYINNVSPLSKEAEAELSARLKSKTFKKGQLINKQGQICRKLYFINKGLVKHYYHHKNRTFIIRFFSEHNVFTVLDSFVRQTPAEFMTIALEDSELTYLDDQDVEALCRNHHSFETFIRKTFSMAAVINLKRIKEMFDADATELYKSFVKENKHLLPRISLGDIASYLGISQVSLSRIRAKS